MLLGVLAAIGAGGLVWTSRPRGPKTALATDPEMAEFAYVDGFIVPIDR